MTLKLLLTKSLGIRKEAEAMRLVISPKKTVSCFNLGLTCNEAPIATRIPKAICVGRSAAFKLNLWKRENDQRKSAGAT